MSCDDATDPSLVSLSPKIPPTHLQSRPSTSGNLKQIPAAPTSSGSTATLKKRAHTTLSDKVMILNFIKQNPSLDQATVAKHFQSHGFPTLSQSTISRYIKDAERYQNLALDSTKLNVKKQKQPQLPQVAHCFEFWYYQLLAKGPRSTLSISPEFIRQRWKTFDDILSIRRKRRVVLSPNWLETFQEQPKRFTFPESTRSIVPTSLKSEIDRIRHITKQYDISDILAMDEIALAYACPPSARVLIKQQPKLTLVFTCSADGSWKDLPLIIGESFKSQAYLPDQLDSECGFHYCSNQKAVMTFQVWEKYLTDLNEKCQVRGQKVLLLVDTSKVHLLPEPVLDNIRVEYINTLAIAGYESCSPPALPFVAISRCFKSEYRIRLCLRALSSEESDLCDLFGIDQAAATRIIQDSWNCVTSETICNAFKHTSLLSPQHYGDAGDSEYYTPDKIITEDPSTEQSIKSLTMCLTQLKIKLRMTDSPEQIIQDPESQYSDEMVCNMDPALSQLSRSFSMTTPASIADEEEDSRCTDAIVTALTFVNIDTALATEAEWTDEEIVDHVLSERRGPLLTAEHSPSGDSLALDNVDDGLRFLKRNRSIGPSEGHEAVDIVNPELSRQRLMSLPTTSQACVSTSYLRSSTSSACPSQSGSQDRNHLSSFSCHIRALESLRSFCATLADKETWEGEDEVLIARYLPMLGELEDELRTLEAVELSRTI